MIRLLLFALYNIAYPLFLLISLPGFCIKMRRRDGSWRDIWERIGLFRLPARQEPQRVIYVHAVSVGEVFIALKWIRDWRSQHPNSPVVLATSTATGLQVAREANLPHLRVLYSPVDWGCVVGRVFRRFTPRIVVLIEAELWPNHARLCRKMGIPMVMLNARLSPRSEKRYAALRPVSRILFSYLSALAAQNENDAARFTSIGVNPAIISVTGSIKFDVLGATPPAPRSDFAEILRRLSVGKPVVLACSTHAGEELLIAEAARSVGAFPLIVPRHMERRTEIVRDLSAAGFTPILRSAATTLPATPSEDACYIADTTGELRDWTALSTVAVIGKSFLADGGQNPVEAIAAHVPVVVGPKMSNFADLVNLLLSKQAILTCSAQDIAATLKRILDDPQAAACRAKLAYETVHLHSGATHRSSQLVESLLPPEPAPATHSVRPQ